MIGDQGTEIISVMSRGEPQQNIIVVPDSGDGQLAGLAGKRGLRASGACPQDDDHDLQRQAFV